MENMHEESWHGAANDPCSSIVVELIWQLYGRGACFADRAGCDAVWLFVSVRLACRRERYDALSAEWDRHADRSRADQARLPGGFYTLPQSVLGACYTLGVFLPDIWIEAEATVSGPTRALSEP